MKCKKCHSYALNIAPKSGFCDVCYYKSHLFNLLAILHGDGGHYIDKHGVDKAVKDGKKIAANKVAR